MGRKDILAAELTKGLDIKEVEHQTIHGWSPNNVRRLIIGYGGAIVQYFVKGGKYGNLVEFVDYSEGTEEDEADFVGGDYRSILRVLVEGRICSSIEEIFFCTKGYGRDLLSEDANLECIAKDVQGAETRFVRLYHASYVDCHIEDCWGIMRQGEIDVVGYDSLLGELKEKYRGIKISSTIISEEWYKGTFMRSKYYSMDNEGGELGEYFCRAREIIGRKKDKEKFEGGSRVAAVIRGQKENKENGEKEKEFEQVLEGLVTKAFNCCSELYSDFENRKPFGLLVGGYICNVHNGKLVVDYAHATIKPMAKKLYGKDVVLDKGNKFYTLSDGSIPLFHLYNIYRMDKKGVVYSSWEDFIPVLKKELEEIISFKLGKFEDITKTVQDNILKEVNKCIILLSFNVSENFVIRMTTNNVDNEGNSDVKNECELKIIKENIVGFRQSSVVADIVTGNVRLFAYVDNRDAASKNVLFAYEALGDSGHNFKYDAINFPVGKTIDGRELYFPLGDPSVTTVALFAASGAGKGVMLLNLVAHCMNRGYPVIYSDSKPDMATVFWELERLLTDNGYNSRVLAVDRKNGKAGDKKPVREFEFGHKAVVSKEDKTMMLPVFKSMAYLKTIQLLSVLGNVRMNYEQLSWLNKCILFVDEAQTAGEEMFAVIKTLKHKRNSKDSYKSKIVQFLESVEVWGGDTKNTSGRKGESTLFFIGQNSNPQAYNNNIFKGIVTGVQKRILGIPADTKGGKVASEKNLGFKINVGEFILSDSSDVVNIREIDKIKAYTLFMENDYSESKDKRHRKEVNKMLASKDSETRIKLIKEKVYSDYENRVLREELGFLGLLQKLEGGGLQELSKKASLGYLVYDLILHLAGLSERYTCVEDYLFDCSYEGIFTSDELTARIDSNKNLQSILAKFEKDYREGNLVYHVNGVGDEDIWEEENQYVEEVHLLNTNTYSPVGIGQRNEDIRNTNNYSPVGIGQRNEDIRNTINSLPTYNESRPRVRPAPKGELTANMDIREEIFASMPGIRNEIKQTSFSDFMKSPLRSLGEQIANTPAVFSSFNFKRATSVSVLEYINKAFGGLDRVHSVVVSHSGLMMVNGIEVKPTFSEAILNYMPIDVREDIKNGNIIELFDFMHLTKFPNLYSLEIDNASLAERRIRKELGMNNRVSWSVLFNKLRNLEELAIGGVVIKDGESASAYDKSGRGGHAITESVRKTLGVADGMITTYRSSKLYNTLPVRVFTGALGLTVGVKVVSVAASAFGFWGLVFGALVVGSTYKQLKKK